MPAVVHIEGVGDLCLVCAAEWLQDQQQGPKSELIVGPAWPAKVEPDKDPK
jgi:hypothetical protein